MRTVIVNIVRERIAQKRGGSDLVDAVSEQARPMLS
jgi:hypothetical protein